jgi:hypothetical protein
METTFFRFCNKEGADKDKVFQVIQSMLLLSTIVLCGACILLSNPIAELLQYPHQGHLITYLFGVIGIDTLLALSFAKLRLEGKAKKFAFVKLFNILLNIVLNIWFLVVMPMIHPAFTPDVSYVLTANLIANLAQFLFFPLDYLLSTISGTVFL